MARLEAYAYVLMRIVFGLLFLFHGLQKLFGMFGGRQMSLESLAGVAGLIEAVGGSLIMFGCWTGPTRFSAAARWRSPIFFDINRALWPIQNGGELAALYCFTFLFIGCAAADR